MATTAEYQRKWRKKNPGYAAKKSREYYARNPGAIRRANLRKYGLTIEQFDEMYRQQNGCCASCKCASEETLCVDHNHTTGAVRSLLCANCNTAFGHLKEDPARIVALLEYAQKFSCLKH